ncbi:hypothetical protein ACJRO7_002156 [Eucalyptus globulus]|uniref:Uncharacterized protein n=1 Tax=Eucalyptus globulus TaxID=34317 RepID=A0ABD3LYK9_EUCGL
MDWVYARTVPRIVLELRPRSFLWPKTDNCGVTFRSESERALRGRTTFDRDFLPGNGGGSRFGFDVSSSRSFVERPPNSFSLSEDTSRLLGRPAFER